MEKLSGPREGWVLRHRLGQEQGPTEPDASQPWESEPLVFPASMMTVASEIRAIVRFRSGKFFRCTGEPAANCETAR